MKLPPQHFTADLSLHHLRCINNSHYNAPVVHSPLLLEPGFQRQEHLAALQLPEPRSKSEVGDREAAARCSFVNIIKYDNDGDDDGVDARWSRCWQHRGNKRRTNSYDTCA